MDIDKLTEQILQITNNSDYGWIHLDSADAERIRLTVTKALSLGSVMRWVEVSERLPETKQQVLVIRTNPKVVTTGYIHEYGHWIWSNLNGSTHKADHIYKVTHWMPLPEPPSKKS